MEETKETADKTDSIALPSSLYLQMLNNLIKINFFI